MVEWLHQRKWLILLISDLSRTVFARTGIWQIFMYDTKREFILNSVGHCCFPFSDWDGLVLRKRNRVCHYHFIIQNTLSTGCNIYIIYNIYRIYIALYSDSSSKLTVLRTVLCLFVFSNSKQIHAHLFVPNEGWVSWLAICQRSVFKRMWESSHGWG